MKRRYLLLLWILLFTSTAFAQRNLKLATTTSTYDSGLLDVLLPPFTKKFRDYFRIDVIAVGTGKALKLAENGDVDVVLVHARKLEDAFVAAGYGVYRQDVMYNDFIVIGPSDDPARIGGMKVAVRRLRKLQKKRRSSCPVATNPGRIKKRRPSGVRSGYPLPGTGM